jgi:cyanophycin synthetase
VPKLLQKALLEHGVAAERISIIPEEAVAVDAALREGRPGDLVLIFADAITRSWKQVIQFRPDAAALPSERTRISEPEMAMAGVAPLMDDKRREFVRDTRGVRMARAEMDD